MDTCHERLSSAGLQIPSSDQPVAMCDTVAYLRSNAVAMWQVRAAAAQARESHRYSFLPSFLPSTRLVDSKLPFTLDGK